MPFNPSYLLKKSKYVYGVLALLLVSLVCLALRFAGSDDFDLSRREILLRRIGHELLWQAGDSTSRVLAVEKAGDDTYQVKFEQPLSFTADALVETTRRILAKDPFATDYVVNVRQQGHAGIAYGFAVSANGKNDIVSCTGRKQPTAPYIVEVKFKPTGINTAENGYPLTTLPVIAFVGFICWIVAGPKRKNTVAAEQTLLAATHLPDEQYQWGGVLFDVKSRLLQIDGKTVPLTGTETRVLQIFAAAPNTIIERNRLQKEIWEDEGVIVGRSLDMFISKLRKKLEPDPATRIVVIRGKGYKLETGC